MGSGLVAAGYCRDGGGHAARLGSQQQGLADGPATYDSYGVLDGCWHTAPIPRLIALGAGHAISLVSTCLPKGNLLINYLKRWFDKPVLSEVEGLTTKGERSFYPFVLSLSKDGSFWVANYEIYAYR